MGAEQWAFLAIAVVSGLIGAFALYYAKRASHSSEKSVDIAEKQLELARKQDEVKPLLEVDIRLLEVRNIESLTGVQRQEMGAIRRPEYSGPPPDRIIHAVVMNTGRTAAYEVTAWISFDTAYWEPLPYFTDDSSIREIHTIGDVSDGLLRRQVQIGGKDSILRATPKRLPLLFCGSLGALPGPH